jgi:hypothetical protein
MFVCLLIPVPLMRSRYVYVSLHHCAVSFYCSVSLSHSLRLSLSFNSFSSLSALRIHLLSSAVRPAFVTVAWLITSQSLFFAVVFFYSAVFRRFWNCSHFGDWFVSPWSPSPATWPENAPPLRWCCTSSSPLARPLSEPGLCDLRPRRSCRAESSCTPATRRALSRFMWTALALLQPPHVLRPPRPQSSTSPRPVPAQMVVCRRSPTSSANAPPSRACSATSEPPRVERPLVSLPLY